MIRCTWTEIQPSYQLPDKLGRARRTAAVLSRFVLWAGAVVHVAGEENESRRMRMYDFRNPIKSREAARLPLVQLGRTAIIYL